MELWLGTLTSVPSSVHREVVRAAAVLNLVGQPESGVGVGN